MLTENSVFGSDLEQVRSGGAIPLSQKPWSEISFQIAKYRGFYATEPYEQVTTTLGGVLAFLLNNGQPYLTADKHKAPYFTGPLREAPFVGKTLERKKRGGLDGADLIGVQRSKGHSLGGQIFKFDLDDAPMDELAFIRKRIKDSGLAAAMFTTWSHGKTDAYRGRLLVFGNRLATVDEFAAVSEFLGRKLVGKTYDPSEHRCYQLAGVWSCHPDRADLAKRNGQPGLAVDIDGVLERIRRESAANDPAQTPGSQPAPVDNSSARDKRPWEDSPRNRVELESALFTLSSNDENDWHRRALGLYGLGDWGRDLFLRWSEQCCTNGKFDREAALKKLEEKSRYWNETAGTISLRAIFHDARAGGWTEGQVDYGLLHDNLSAKTEQGTAQPPDEDCIEMLDEAEAEDNSILAARQMALIPLPAEDITKRLEKEFPAHQNLDAVVKDAVAWAARYQPGRFIKQNGVRKRITSLARLNGEFARLEVPRQRSAIIHIPDKMPVSQEDFNTRVADQVVIAGVTSKGLPRALPAGDFWRKDAGHRRYREMAFTSRPVADSVFNLFAGLGATPVKGSCPKVHQHLHEVICAGDQDKYEAMLNLIAWQVQHIGQCSRIIVVLQSDEQQVGKGLFAEQILAAMFGPSAFVTSNTEHGLGRFNAPLQGKAVFIMDEALFSGDQKTANRIKSYAASTVLAVEEKNLPVISMPSGLNVWMLTNQRHAAHVEIGDARYWILKVASHRREDFDYFEEVVRELENGGREAFLFEMLNRNISRFKPARDVPRNTDCLTESKELSLPPGHVLSWLIECCEAGHLVGVENHGTGMAPDWPTEPVKGSALVDIYRNWIRAVQNPRKRESPQKDIWATLTAAGFELIGPKKDRKRVVPTLEDCTAAVRALLQA